MQTLDAYSDLQLLFAGKTFSWFRANRHTDGKPRLFKTLSSDYPRAEDLIFLERDFAISEHIASAAALRPEGLLRTDKRLFVIYPDFSGLPLLHYLRGQNRMYLDPAEAIKVFSEIVRAVGNLHKNKLIHRGLNPSSILFEPLSGTVQISGFGFSTFTDAEKLELEVERYEMENALAYISPEQTGRMSAEVDQRSDFYALGITFYECLSRQLPFPFSDAMGLIHSHIAQEAPEIRSLNAAIPASLAALIHKLIAKNGRDRYQSARGILTDLQKCLELLEKGALETTFPLGATDISDLLFLPEHSFGREMEINNLCEILENPDSDRFSAVFVSGPSGMGKSTLMKAVKSRFAERSDIYFLSGTYKNYTRNVPFSGITSALTRVVEQILSAPGDILQQKKQKIQAALGNQGKLLTELMPELELLLGEQGALDADLTPEEADNRLKTTLLNFIIALLEPMRRMVLFLDDMHLADGASLAFLKTLSQHHFGQSLVLIGAHIPPAHPEGKNLDMLLDTYKQNAATHCIELKPLSKQDLQQLIAEILQGSELSSPELIEQLHAKTNGTPIFILEYLQRAYKQGILFFDDKQNCWKWEKEGLENLPLADNVVDLMLGKVQELSEDTRTLLKKAACIGPRFDLGNLSVLVQKTEEETWTALTEALLLAFIVVDRSWSYTVVNADFRTQHQLSELEKSLAFSHDRLHQALYSLVSEAEKKQNHFLIASNQLKILSQKELDRNLFDLANHLHYGRTLISTGEMREQAIHLFAAAAAKSKNSSSYALAYTYLSDASDLFTPALKAQASSRYFEIELERLECAFLADEAEEGENLYHQLMESMGSTMEKARILQVKAMSQLHLSNYAETYRISREALTLFGIHLPNKPGQQHLLPEIIKTRLALGNKTEEDLLALPVHNNPKAQIIEALYYRSLPYALSTSKELYAIISLRMLRITLKYGHGAFSYSGFNLYGQILALGFGQFKKGYGFNQLGLASAQKLGNIAAIGGAQFGMAMGGVHTQPLQECIEFFEAAHDNLNLGGNIYYASTATSMITLYHLLKGMPLSLLKEKALGFQRYAHNANQPDTIQFQQSCIAFIDLLAGPLPAVLPAPENPLNTYPNFSEIHASWFFTIQMQAAFFLNAPETGLNTGLMAEKDMQAIFFDIMFPEFYFFRSLLQARLYPQSNQEKQRRFLRDIEKSVKIFKKRAKFGPDNYQHKLHILRGIWHHLKGKPEKALAEYGEAIVLCQKGKYLQYAAIAHECAFLANPHHAGARQHLKEAFQYMEQWGAQAVCTRLLHDYPDALNGSSKRKAEALYATGAGSIDFKTVLKASQVLSSEIDLSKLLANLIRITIENAGAQCGYLLVEGGPTGWTIEASGAIEQPEVNTRISIPVANNTTELALAVVNYVSRTRKAVVLEEATQDQRFSLDPYVVARRPKSIACYPIVNQGQLIGILYLENNLAAGAFTPERAEVLGLLSGQAGISLQNALLFDQVKSLNRAYERFVPKEFLKYLNKERITDVKLGDHVQQEMTVMFADIRSFTILSERLSPRENFQFINDYLGMMEPVIRKYHGFVDKYIGDAIMALFPTSADDALQASLEMMDKLAEFNQNRTEDIRIGIGLNTGNLILGTVGGQDRMESTVISDAVNIASRIESMTKTYGVNLLISENTYARLYDPEIYPIRLLDQVAPEGKTGKIAIYEVLAGEEPEILALKKEDLSKFEKALLSLKLDDNARANALFQEIVLKNPGDKPALFFLQQSLQS